MKKRFKDKINHPIFGKHHVKELLLNSKPGSFNLMFGKKHSDYTKNLKE